MNVLEVDCTTDEQRLRPRTPAEQASAAAADAGVRAAQQAVVDPAAIGAALDALPADQPLTKADLAPLLALFGAAQQTGK